MTDLGEVLTTARRASGLTQEKLAERAGVTQAALSRYENGLREPDDATLEVLARALGVTTRFMKHAGRVRGAAAVDAHMRRRATAPATVWKKLEARLNMYRMHVSVLSEEIQIRSNNRVPTFDPIDTTPDAAARMVRMQWSMPIGPVRNLVGWLESAGCLIIEESFGTTRVDGMSQWIGEQPVIYINSDSPTDRKRLTLAHELGHLVLHSTEVVEEIEEQANEFAAEFLMPIEVIKPQLRNLRIDVLPDLKRQWGVSMAALIERAYRSGFLAASKRVSMYKIFGSRGWRTSEPVSNELVPERPTLAAAIAQALVDRGLSASEIADIAGFASPQDNDVFAVRKGGLRVL
ncbi:MAG: XRE family transcriptional regulator [Microlunatus sp.]